MKSLSATDIQFLISAAAAAGLLVWLLARTRIEERVSDRLRLPGNRVVTSLLAVCALIAAVNYFYNSRQPGSWLHRWDLFHTVMTARYFDELGYTGLYECAYVTDATTNQHYTRVDKIRDLKTQRYIKAKPLLKSSDCESRFTPERREAFVRDLEFMNELMPRSRWRHLFKDKGYNGSPYTLTLARVLLQGGELSRARLRALAVIDIVLVLLAFAFVARAFGLRVALIACIFFFVNFPNRFVHMGGSILRFSYLAELVIAVCMLKQKRFGWAGFLMALAGMERLFPFLFAVGLWAKATHDSLRAGKVDRDYARFFGVFVATCVVSVAVSAVVNGVDAWTAFLENMRVHNRHTAGFRIGFRHLFMLGGNIAGPEGFVPFVQKTEIFRSMWVPYLAAVAAFFAALTVLIRRLGVLPFTIVFGLVTFFLLFNATRYYYSVLVLLFLLGYDWRRVRWYGAAWALLFAMTAIVYIVRDYNAFDPFLYNTLFSAIFLGFYVFLLTAMMVRASAWSSTYAGGPIRARWILLVIVAVAVVAATGYWRLDRATSSDVAQTRGDNRRAHSRQITDGAVEVDVLPAFDAQLLDRIARIVAAAGKNDENGKQAIQTESRDYPCLGVQLRLREGGRSRCESWVDGDQMFSAIAAGVDSLQNLCGQWTDIENPTIEVFVVHSTKAVSPSGDQRELANTHRGIHGLELVYRDDYQLLTPADMIARNLRFSTAITRFADRHDVPNGRSETQEARLRTAILGGVQLLVFLGAEPRAVVMERGNELVPLDEVTQEAVTEMADGLADWLARQVNTSGRMTYKYWPSRGEESESNNMIRQWMATLALIRTARAHDDANVLSLAGRNIRYNLDNFYKEENGLGLIEWNQKVKLGAVALAALALVEHPDRDRFASYEAALLRTVDDLHKPDGSFVTFYKPSGRMDNQNFYPGETLLLWATLYQQSRDPELLTRIMASFRYYREWHRQNRNPAFIPWHTQAYHLVWQETRDRELEKFIFEMNDWLLSMQQWDTAPYPDLRGRFYDPARSYFGPPHASSTGVYLEGLIDAWALAKELGDEDRQEAYRRVIVRALRWVRQAQFVDAVDLFYVSRPDPVRDGVRTTLYDNTIRIDNVQHNLMGIIKILARFSPDDFRP